MNRRPFYVPWLPRLAEIDVVDLHFREALPVSLLARVILPAPELEDDDLVALAVTHDFARDLGLGDRHALTLHVLPVVAEENVGELDLAAGLTHERRNAVFLARLDAELLAAGSDDCVRHVRNWFCW